MSDLWDVGLVGRRTCGMSDLLDVGLMGRRTYGMSDLWGVGLMGGNLLFPDEEEVSYDKLSRKQV